MKQSLDLELEVPPTCGEHLVPTAADCPGAVQVPHVGRPRGHVRTLAAAGIDKKLSSRAQKMAAIPEPEFEGCSPKMRRPKDPTATRSGRQKGDLKGG